MKTDQPPFASFPQSLHVGRPVVGNEQLFLQYTRDMLERQWFTNNGPLVQKLEHNICEYLQVKHTIAVSNATLALMLAAQAMELQGEVIVPSFTFIATAHAMAWQGLQPVFADVDPVYGLIDPASVEALITPQTSAILGVHLWGKACQIEALEGLALRNNIELFFDAAHAFGTNFKGRKIGNFGRCECFSLHSTKIFHSFEGGLITTNDTELAKKIRLARNFGITGEDQCAGLGMNAKMTESCAAMGLSNFDNLEKLIAINKNCWQRYAAGLADIPGLSLICYKEEEQSNYHYIMLRVDEKHFGLSRDALKMALQEKNVLARRYFTPGCHRLPPYSTQSIASLPHTEVLCEQCLVLPNGEQMQEGYIETLCAFIRHLHSASTKSSR